MKKRLRWLGVVGDADALGPVVVGRGLKATTETKIVLSQELEK